MIYVEVGYDSYGRINRVVSRGHGTKIGGISIPCSHVTSSLKVFGKILTMRSGVDISGKSRGPGDLEFQIEGLTDENVQWFMGVQDFFLAAIQDLEKHFPQEVRINIQKGKE